MVMIQCAKCGKELYSKEGGDRVASISGGITGYECVETYYFCKKCDVYSVEVYWDCFLGDEEVSFRGPLSKEEGDEKVRLIGECSEPWDKNCRCDAHRAYFGDSLD
jgi:hypothetical protein